MKNAIKGLVRKMLGALGWQVMRPSYNEIVLYKSKNVVGIDEGDDLARLFDRNARIVIVDAGANMGQSAEAYKVIFPNAIVHSYEPSEIFSKLHSTAARLKDVHAHRLGLGSKPGVLRFYQYEDSVNSSFLPIGNDLWQGNTFREIDVECTTLDIHIRGLGLDHINILKVDTQGFDLEVLKGTQSLIDAGKVDIIVIEHIVAELYKGTPRYSEQVKFFEDNNFRLIASYRLNFDNGVVTFFDSVYAREGFKPHRTVGT